MLIGDYLRTSERTLIPSSGHRRHRVAVGAISLALQGRTGRNRDGPRLSGALVESARSPRLSFASPANSGIIRLDRSFLIARRGNSKIASTSIERTFPSVLFIEIDGIWLPPLAASPDARRARCCEREPRPIDILSPVPTRVAASSPRLACPRTPCLSVNVRETIAQIVATYRMLEIGGASCSINMTLVQFQ